MRAEDQKHAKALARAGRAGGFDLRRWVENSSLPPGGLMVGGVALAGLGLALGLALPLTMGTATLFGGMVTFGGGIAFLGGLKRTADAKRAELKALQAAPRTSPVVLAERARRVQTLLDGRGQETFEGLLEGLKWTERALLETLLHMTQSGLLEEDLDLDTGQWIYRGLDATDAGQAASVMLTEPQARNG